MLARAWLCALAALAGGCVESLCTARVYQPLVVKSSATSTALLDAAERAMRELGARSIDVARADSRVSAILDERDHVREHWRVQVTDWGDVAIDVRTELQADDGTWIAPDTVCDDYSHAREKRVAERLLKLVRG
ncbi:MAG TPA: hypothetical protein VFF06_31940 [Polyangia bacterium]|nr:hypothetical protein [Polyangia bacterium]